MDTPTGEGKSAQAGLFGGAVALVVIAALAGIYWYDRTKPATETVPEPVALTGPVEPQADPATAEAKVEVPSPEPVADATDAEPVVEAAETESAAAPEPVLAQAAFDAFRAAPDGMMTLAGQAEPGALVEFLLDGVVIGSATATARGEFAAVLEAAPSESERLLSLRVTSADGVVREAEETLVVQPVAVAAAEEAAEPAPAPAIVADAEGARVLGGEVEQLVIDTLAQQGVAEGGVISGRGAPVGSVLRAYLDNAEVGLTSLAPDGSWSMVIPALSGVAQLLRIDAIDASGEVVARAETELTPAAPVEAVALETEALRESEAVAATAPAPAVAPVEEAMPAAVAPQAMPATPKPVQRLTVTQGNSLWAIAREVYGDGLMYVRVFEANKGQIRDPDLIYPGQVFEIPQ